jgi:hypothetical protein
MDGYLNDMIKRRRADNERQDVMDQLPQLSLPDPIKRKRRRPKQSNSSASKYEYPDTVPGNCRRNREWDYGGQGLMLNDYDDTDMYARALGIGGVRRQARRQVQVGKSCEPNPVRGSLV